MNKVLIYKLNLYDIISNKYLLDDFIVNGNYKEFIAKQQNKLKEDIVNYKYYIEFFVLINKIFNENNFALISNDYNNICDDDYEDMQDMDYYSFRIKEIPLDFECQVYNCVNNKHKCSKLDNISIINNILSDHIILDNNFKIIIDDLKYEIEITEAHIQIMVRNNNSANFKSIIKLQCHKILYTEPSLFDFQPNKIVIINTFDSIYEARYRIATIVPYICWNTVKQCIYRLLEHIRNCYQNENLYCKILNKSIDYFTTHNNYLDIINNFHISQKVNNVAKLNITNTILDIDLIHEQINRYIFCIHCQIADLPENDIYLSKSKNYYHDISIISY